MRLAILLCLVACAAAVDPATIMAMIANSKAAQEALGGVADIFNNLGKIVGNEGEDTYAKLVAAMGNSDVILDLLQKVKSGEIQVLNGKRDVERSEREVLPPHEEVVKKIEDLYEKIRGLVNPRADKILETYRQLLDKARESYEKIQDFKSLEWLKSWVVSVLNKLDEKLEEYSKRMGELTDDNNDDEDVEKRELIPSRDELLDRLSRLYDRFRAYVNAGADTARDAFGESLDYIRYLLERLDQIKSLNWLRKWIVVLLDRAERKLEEYENDIKPVERREVIPSKDELLKRLGRLYDRFRAYVNAGATTAKDAYAESLDYIRYLIERFDQIKSLEWFKKWIVVLLDRAEKKLEDYEEAVKPVERRELVPTRDELQERLARLYDRFRAYTNAGADVAEDAVGKALDYIRSLIDRLDNFKAFSWFKKWVIVLLDRADKAVAELERRIKDKVAGAVKAIISEQKRELIPTRDELKERLARLYDRFRAYTNAGADVAEEALGKGLDYIRSLIDRLEQYKTFVWIKKLIINLLDRADQKLKELEMRIKDKVTGGFERREVVPPKEEILAKIANLYDRIRGFVNVKADKALDMYKGALDEIRSFYERVERFKSLAWLKRWVVDAVNVLERKIDEFEKRVEDYENGGKPVEKRELIPTRDELKERLARLYDRFRAYTNAGADVAEEALGKGLDYIRSLIDRLEQYKTFVWIKKLIINLLDRADQKLKELEMRIKDKVTGGFERREVVPPKEEILAKIGNLYDRIRGFVNVKADKALDMYKGALDEIRSLYERVEQFKSLAWLKRWAVDTLNALERKIDEFEKRVEDYENNAKRNADLETFHAAYRRDLTEALMEHFDERTARGLGDTIADFFKNKWGQIQQKFQGFADNTKTTWAELLEEIKPILANVQARGSQILDDTKKAAILVRQSAIKTIDTTISKMLQTANNAVNDGKAVVNLIKSHMEKFAQEL